MRTKTVRISLVYAGLLPQRKHTNLQANLFRLNHPIVGMPSSTAHVSGVTYTDTRCSSPIYRNICIVYIGVLMRFGSPSLPTVL